MCVISFIGITVKIEKEKCDIAVHDQVLEGKCDVYVPDQELEGKCDLAVDDQEIEGECDVAVYDQELEEKEKCDIAVHEQELYGLSKTMYCSKAQTVGSTCTSSHSSRCLSEFDWSGDYLGDAIHFSGLTIILIANTLSIFR